MQAGTNFCNIIVELDYESHQSAGMLLRSDPGWCADASSTAKIDHTVAQDGLYRKHRGTQRLARPLTLHCAHAAAQSSRACRQGMSVSYTSLSSGCWFSESEVGVASAVGACSFMAGCLGSAEGVWLDLPAGLDVAVFRFASSSALLKPLHTFWLLVSYLHATVRGSVLQIKRLLRT